MDTERDKKKVARQNPGYGAVAAVLDRLEQVQRTAEVRGLVISQREKEVEALKRSEENNTQMREIELSYTKKLEDDLVKLRKGIKEAISRCPPGLKALRDGLEKLIEKTP